MDDATSVTDESGLETSASEEPELPAGGIVAYPAALREQGQWFPALRFERQGKPFGDDLVLRAVPCATSAQAVAIAEMFLDSAERHGSRS
jgi:hypothetical protein